MMADIYLSNYIDPQGNFYIPSPRDYFDIYSSGFGQTPLGEKLFILAFLISRGMSLSSTVVAYKMQNPRVCAHSLKTTLVSYINVLRWSDPIHWSNDIIGEASDEELTNTLQAELVARYDEVGKRVICSMDSPDLDRSLIDRSKNSRDRLRGLLLQTVNV